MDPTIVLPDLPENYEWYTKDQDYNIRSKPDRMLPSRDSTTSLICYVRPKTHFDTNIIRIYVTNHAEETFDNLQDAINVMAARFTLGLYFQDETA